MSRKSFNLSLQKKRNQIVLSPIIERCETDGSYIADKVVDYVEKALQYERSVGLSKVQNTFELIKNTLSSQYPIDSTEFEQRVEDVLQTLIIVDGERLSQFLSDPNRYSNEASNLPVDAQVANTSPSPLRVHEEVEPTPSPSVDQDGIDTPGDERRKAREAKNEKLKLERNEARSKPKASTPRVVQENTNEDNDNEDVDINESVLRNM